MRCTPKVSVSVTTHAVCAEAVHPRNVQGLCTASPTALDIKKAPKKAKKVSASTHTQKKRAAAQKRKTNYGPVLPIPVGKKKKSGTYSTCNKLVWSELQPS